MAADDFDVVVLGGGTGGYTAAIRAAQLGLRPAVVESEKLGGTCLHVGCIPTKALLESSKLYHTLADRREEFGLTADGVGFDMDRVATRRDGIVDQLFRGVQGLMKKNRVEVVTGRGRLADATTVEVDGRRLKGRGVLVATGSTPRALPGMDFDGERIINSDHAVASRRIPESIAIIGAGAVGVEFATFYRQMGAAVTLIEALDRLVPLEDEDVSSEMLKQFQRVGIDCRIGAKVEGATPDGSQVVVKLSDGEVTAEQLLVAVGRSPRSAGIGLEEAGVEMHANGFVKVDEWMHTNVPGVYAIGDVAGGFLLAHAAVHEGAVAVEDMAGKRIHAVDQDEITRCTYSHPEIASVGLTEKQAEERGIEVKVGRFPFAANGRALIHGEGTGFAKMVANADTGELLGAHVIGVEATELIAEAGLARLFQADAWEVGRAVHPHPTLSEAIGEAALAVDGTAVHI
jgi:dihydrolipoamide dehydrogenase